MPPDIGLDAELQAFESGYSTTREDEALATRGDFLKAFPLQRLKVLTLDDYVIGMGTASFCARVEAKSRAWANIQGATSFKFGIYFGRTKTDAIRKYRFSSKFGESAAEAFENVKAALLSLVQAGATLDFQAIDANPLSQMFKAKILSLYFPDKFLNVCSDGHLTLLAGKLGIGKRPYISEYQHLLLGPKNRHTVSRRWSNPRYMEFLYRKFIPQHLNKAAALRIGKPRKGAHRRINFEDLQEGRDAIGKLSEAFALAWEQERLTGLGHPELIAEIADRRDRPAYGYDFLSHSAPGQERYIEVKSVGKDKGCFRFFLSENERGVSESDPSRNDYFFYLVFYGRDRKPERLVAIPATELYPMAQIDACAFRVSFSIDEAST